MNEEKKLPSKQYANVDAVSGAGRENNAVNTHSARIPKPIHKPASPKDVPALILPIYGIIILFIALPLAGIAAYYWPQHAATLLSAQTILGMLGLFLIISSIRCIKSNFLRPLVQLREWVRLVRWGDHSAPMPELKQKDFAALAKDINSMGVNLLSLNREMDDRVNRQTISLQRKTRSLEILYDVAARSNSAKNLDDLLTRFLHTLTEIVYAHAGTVRLVTDDHQMRLVGSIGLDDSIVERVKLVPLERCLCAQDFSKNMILCTNDFSHCPNLVGEKLFAGDKLENIAIPLRYQNTTLGIYNLFVEKLGLTERDDIKDILTNIGQHLSMAIEKAHWTEESKRISIMQERTMLAHELHDSLAQTLASLRFRVSMLQQSIAQAKPQDAEKEIEKLKDGMDEANFELRELLAHFRVRMDERGLIPAMETLVDRFEKDCAIQIFFQNECPQLKLPPVLEVHLLHIVQEALANIRKHSDAKNVRILMRCKGDEHLHLLIEDDGMGIEEEITSSHPGEHVGLTIMKERAKRIGATLSIESEPGEGTRIELELIDISNHPSSAQPFSDSIME
jgi:two-component system nitrate/nitrite sensor histidine kinase NarX